MFPKPIGGWSKTFGTVLGIFVLLSALLVLPSSAVAHPIARQPAQANACGEALCTPVTEAYISHFTGLDCIGEEHYYTPYFFYDGVRRSWDGQGLAGTTLHTVTNRSWRGADGQCHNDWPNGNTLSDFVRIYRGTAPTTPTPLIVSQENTLNDSWKHMWSEATLHRGGVVAGRLLVQTRTWSSSRFEGFTGGVLIVLRDAYGTPIAVSGVHSFGVNGTWIPGAPSDRLDYWQEQFDPGIAAATAQLEIIHEHTPVGIRRVCQFYPTIPGC